MSDAFKMHLPLEAAYQAMVPEVANRYAELLGASPVDAAALAAAVTTAIDRIGTGAAPGTHIDLAFRPNGAGVHIEVSGNGRRETVDFAMSVIKH